MNIKFKFTLLSLCLFLFTSKTFKISSASEMAAHQKPVIWLIAASALQRLREVPGAAALAQETFDHPETFVIVGEKPPHFLTRWKCQWGLSFPSYHAFDKRMKQGTLPHRVKFIILDQESWRFTPEKEKLNPSYYIRKSALLAHQYHLKLIATPAVDLVNSEIGRRRFSTHFSKYSAFLKLKIPQKCGAYADLYEIQAQGSEKNLKIYLSFVKRAAHQAAKINPHLIILAGLSTNPSGQKVTAERLYRDFQTTREFVEGYWLNVPAGGKWCPRCGKPDPGVGIRFLRKIAAGLR